MLPGQIPYGSAYGVVSIAAQEALRQATRELHEEAFTAYADFRDSVEDDRARSSTVGTGPLETPSQISRGESLVAISARLPGVYADRYASAIFLKRWLVSLSILGWKLAQAETQPFSSVVEMLALHLISEDAIGLLEDRGQGDLDALLQLRELPNDEMEDDEVLELYYMSDPSEISEIDPGDARRPSDLRFERWFYEFKDGGIGIEPHPS